DVDPEIDLCGARESGLVEGGRQPVDLEPPAPAEAEFAREIARESDLAGERVAERAEVVEDRRVVALAEGRHERFVEEAEQPSEQLIALDAGVISFHGRETVGERRTEAADVGGRVREGVGVVDDDELVVARGAEREPDVPTFPALAVEAVLVE